MKFPRRLLIPVLVLPACLAMMVHSLALGMGSFALASYRSLSRANYTPTDEADAGERARLLRDARAFIPSDAALREYGRFCFHMADSRDPGTLSAVLKVLLADKNSFDSSWDIEKMRTTLLFQAAAAFAEAAERNNWDAHSHFWAEAAWVQAARGTEKYDSLVDWDVIFGKFDRSFLLDPFDGKRLLAAGMVSLKIGDRERAKVYFRQALLLRPDLFDQVAGALVTTPTAIQDLAGVTPNTPAGQKKLYRHLMESWRFPEAREAWRRWRRLAGLFALESDQGVLVANGSFEKELGSSFHDWEVIGLPGVRVERKWEGNRSMLSVSLDPGPDNYFHVYQDIPVEPGGRYRLRARLRAGGFGPETRLGVEVIHPLSPGLFAAGDQCYRSTGPAGESAKVCRGTFVDLEFEFIVPEGLPVIRLRLRRHGGGGEKSVPGVLDLGAVSLQALPKDEKVSD